jgi:hypothetical protein
MRRERLTYPGAFHHCMNRGIGGEAILAGEKNKTAFMDILAKKVVQYRMGLFAYTVMDTHYHLFTIVPHLFLHSSLRFARIKNRSIWSTWRVS